MGLRPDFPRSPYTILDPTVRWVPAPENQRTTAYEKLLPPQGELAVPAFEEVWTGGYIFENEWQSFRTRQNRMLVPAHVG